MKGLEEIIREHPFFDGLNAEQIGFLAGCARNHYSKEGEYLFREGDPANEFYLIRDGVVALEIVPPGQSPIVFQTLGPGQVVGASWLVAPYRKIFDARAVEPTRAIGVDAECLRAKCDRDHDLGYEIMTRFLPIFVNRLHATRLQIMDVYGTH
ncbi:cyclic nucleotide-binding domain-containing protein [Consotaella aegiceratis]|uniref:cyclic nucleotide-binding domain-containing protein n=1 Tax=Consotaella aegiceratis TaxID=3097961 RepID=UPI002F41E7C8